MIKCIKTTMITCVPPASLINQLTLRVENEIVKGSMSCTYLQLLLSKSTVWKSLCFGKFVTRISWAAFALKPSQISGRVLKTACFPKAPLKFHMEHSSLHFSNRQNCHVLLTQYKYFWNRIVFTEMALIFINKLSNLFLIWCMIY